MTPEEAWFALARDFTYTGPHDRATAHAIVAEHRPVIEAALSADLDRLRAALNDENEIAHGEAVVERDDGVYPLGFCAYGDGEWPCRTQRGIDRALAALGDRAAEEGR